MPKKLKVRALLSAACGIVLATGHASAAVDPVSDLEIVGGLPDKMNDVQMRFVGLMFVQARNDLANTPEGESEPWPCKEDSGGAVFLRNTPQAYKDFRAGVVKQGYKLENEVAMENNTTMAFLFKKGKINIVGMWSKGVVGNRSTLALCESSTSWKPSPKTKVKK